MKRHLNTLFVTTQGTYLAKDGRAVVVRVEKETRLGNKRCKMRRA